MLRNKTAEYKAVMDGGGWRFLFYCQVSGAHACTTKEIYFGEPEEALASAWKEEGCQYFNQCHRCGSWVIDALYNAEVLECVDCAPYEAEPRFCKACSAGIKTPGKHCIHCGCKLIYEGGGPYDAKA